MSDVLSDGTNLSRMPVSLRSANGPSHGLLSAWRIGSGAGQHHAVIVVLEADELDEAYEAVARMHSEALQREQERDAGETQAGQAAADAEASEPDAEDSIRHERDYLREEIAKILIPAEVGGQSKAFGRTRSQADAVAASAAPALIHGEVGVGKQTIARLIHELSERADRPWIGINLASVPSEMLESELFGHVAGAVPFSDVEKVGRFELAAGGTLFLYEVGAAPAALQQKLLRAVQTQEFERIGEGRLRKANTRLIAASSRDLEAMVKAGIFDDDLYYQLSVFPIEVPPLRDRLDDIVPLAQHFLDQAYQESGRSAPELGAADAARLRRYRWPGNVRELKSVMERAALVSGDGDLHLDLAGADISAGDATPVHAQTADGEFMTYAEFRESEKHNLVAALSHANWKVWGPGGAAELLGMKPSTLTYRMKILGIYREK